MMGKADTESWFLFSIHTVFGGGETAQDMELLAPLYIPGQAKGLLCITQPLVTPK